LLKKGAPFQWLATQENFFHKLKQKTLSFSIPIFRELILTTDARNEGIGAVLLQSTIGADLPIAYASRILSFFKLF
jgi:hypothetical protein